MKKVRWGIIGCGLIAPKFIDALHHTGEGEVVAVASKSMHRAKRLKNKFGIQNAYRGYENMLVYEQLDAVYIATSHNYHFDNAKLCLNRGVPVLIEKALTRNAQEADVLMDLACAKKTFMMEAMWTRFNPSIVELLQRLEDGVIGEIKHLHADFCTQMPICKKTLPWNRMYNPYLAGGAMLDVGVYPIAFSHMVFGRAPEHISGSIDRTWTGVDQSSTYSLDYGKGVRAELSSSFVKNKPRHAVITGTNGIIKVPTFMGADHFIITRPGRAPETIRCDAPGFEHEIREVHRCLDEGRLESDLLPLNQSLDVMRTMDTLRSQWDMRFPGE